MRAWGLAHLQAWTYRSAGAQRDARLDLLRGFAVFAMIVDHFGGTSLITPLTGGNVFLVSAAEGFVFLSGFVMGMVYGRRIERVGWLATTEAILRRAVVLYSATVGLTFLFVGLFLFTDLRLWLDRTYGLGLTDPAELFVGTLTLHYTYHGTDILWMYTVMISVSPLLFHLLATGRVGPLLAGSGLLWLAYQNFPSRAAIPWVVDNAVYFPVAAWQLYFVVGLAMGYHRDALAARLGRLPRWPALAVCTLLFGALIVLHWGQETGRLATWPLARVLAGERYAAIFDKPSVAWGRVGAFAIAAAFYFLLTTQFWRPLERLAGWLLTPLGRAALLAYGLHLIAIVAVYNLSPWPWDSEARLLNSFLQALTVAIVWLLVQWWDRLGSLPGRVARLLEGPTARVERRRGMVAAITALLVLVTAGSALLVGPVRGARPADAEAVAEAGTLVSMPEPAAASPARVPLLLVLHDETLSGPAEAAPLVGQARQAGWAVVAPTLEYGAWNDPDEARAAASELLPALRELVENLGQHLDQPTHQRILIYGHGKGGQLAALFALFYPERVQAVAIADAVPCTLPRSALPFPDGIGDLELYGGRPANFDALSLVSFWIQPSAPGDGDVAQTCAWLGHSVDPREQFEQFAGALAGLGVDLRIVRADQPDPGPRALQFLAELAG